ncbi:MAG: anti-sigma factor [Planctomycetota bacterium]
MTPPPPSNPTPPPPPMSDGEAGGTPELEMEREAAALMEAWAQQTPESVPATLRDRIQREGAAMVAAKHSTDAYPVTDARLPDTGNPLWSFVGGFAVAATLAIAAFTGLGWLNTSDEPDTVSVGPANTGPETPTTEPEFTPLTAADFQKLLEDANTPDAINTAAFFQPSPDAPANASGEIVWLADQQRSALRLRGLEPNDPTRTQYQLWVVDPSRDAKHPVDGGVFDITEGDTTLITLDAKLRIDRPTVFAITREQPGGVVVSDGPMLLVAQVTPSG